MLVIGETIIDQYVFCEALGKSGKEPVLVLRDLETQEVFRRCASYRTTLKLSFVILFHVLSFLGEDKRIISLLLRTI